MRRQIAALACAWLGGVALAGGHAGSTWAGAAAPRDHAHQQQPSSRAGWPCAGRPDPSYVATAEATGGQLFMFHPSEVAESGSLMTASFTHPETLFRAVGAMSDGLHEFAVTIDPAVASVAFSVSVQCLQIVEIARPSGRLLQASDPGADHHQFEAGRVVVLRAPEPGPWTVRASGRGLFFVVVQARSTLALGRVQLLDRKAGGLVPAAAPGAPGTRFIVSVPLAGEGEGRRVRLVSALGRPIGDVTRVVAGGDSDAGWIGEAVVPPVPFRVVVSGVGGDGLPFVRVNAPLLGSAAR